MKSKVFSRFFVGAIIWSIVFLSLGLYSAEKAYETDPEVITKLSSAYDIHIDKSRGNYLIHSANFGAAKEEATDSWSFAIPKKQINFKAVNADVSFKTISGNVIQVTAQGKLNRKTATHLLETDISRDELSLRQPDDDATDELRVQIGIPISFQKTIAVKSVSGDVGFEDVMVDELDLTTVSGEISLKQVVAKTLNTKSVSGNLITKDSSISEVGGKTVSGNIEVGQLILSNVELNSISGNVKIQLAKAEDSRFNLRTLSGDIKNIHGSDDQGHHHVDVSTTSGNIEIR